MKPITTIRFDFIEATTSNAQHPTPNSQLSALSVERRALSVERLRRSLEFLNSNRRVPRHDCVRWNAFRYHRASGDDGVVANGHAFENYGVHSDPHIVADFYRGGFQFWPRRSILEIRCERLRIDQSLRRFERMKIRICDPDVPGNEAMRSDVDPFLSHNQRAVKKREIADGAASVLADGKRTAGVTRNMIANDNRVRFFTDELAKDLRALAIKAFTEFDVRRNRVRPPILLHMSILFDVLHV